MSDRKTRRAEAIGREPRLVLSGLRVRIQTLLMGNASQGVTQSEATAAIWACREKGLGQEERQERI